MRLPLLLLPLGAAALASPPLGGEEDPCYQTVEGHKTCGLSHGGGFRCFAGCREGSLKWTNWSSIEDGIQIQFSRLEPGTGEASGLGRCAKIVVTEATNVLGYVLGVRGQDWLGVHDGCGHRMHIPEDEGDIYHDTAHIHNLSFFNGSTDLPFTLAQLDDLDQNGGSGKNFALTVRPNCAANESNTGQNMSYFEFVIHPCNASSTGVTDRALYLTVGLDAAALVTSLVFVTLAWTNGKGVRRWRKEQRRLASISQDPLLQTQLAAPPGRCPCCPSFLASLCGGRARGAGLNDHLLSDSTMDDLLDDQDAGLAESVRTAQEDGSPEVRRTRSERERDRTISKRRAQDEWRAKFMAEHRFTWPYYVWVEPDSTILRVAGQRALQYQEFQWAMIRLLLGLCLPTLLVTAVNLSGTWCRSHTEGRNTAIEQRIGIGMLDSNTDDNEVATDWLCRMSSNNIDPDKEERNWLIVHMIVTLLFAVLTYGVSKRDVLGRNEHSSQMLKLFNQTRLNLLVPTSFWRFAHCRHAASAAILEPEEDGAATPDTAVAEQLDLQGRVRGGGADEQPRLPARPPASEPQNAAQSRPASPQRKVGLDAATSRPVSPERAAAKPTFDAAKSRPVSPDRSVASAAAPAPEPQPEPQLELEAASESPDEGQQPFGAVASSRLGSQRAPDSLRVTGFEYGQSPDMQISRSRGRDAAADKPKDKPPRYALMVRRISTRYEKAAQRAWLRNTLYRVFHRPPRWEVVDILIYRNSRRDECTAFIVFKSPEMPLEIIRRYRDANQHACWQCCGHLQQVSSFCAFLCAGCCPKLPCRRDRQGSGRRSQSDQPVSHGRLADSGAPSVFGWSRDTDRLGMEKWQLQPGPIKEDIIRHHLNRPQWRYVAAKYVGNAVLIVGTALLIFPSTLIDSAVNFFHRLDVDVQLGADGNVDLGSSESLNFVSKYIPTLINYIVIVGALPLLIDCVAYFVEPHFLRSDVYRSVLQKNLLLLFMSSLLIPSLGLMHLDDLEAIVLNTLNNFKNLGSGFVTSIDRESCPQVTGQDETFHTMLEWVEYPFAVTWKGFGDAFSGVAIGYFYRYMVHASLLGLGSALLLIPDKFYAVVSCCLWRDDERKIVWEFPLEYHYSIYCSSMAITLVYAIPHPPILFFGLGYATLKAFGDKYALLFAHEGNLDSHFTDADEDGGADTLDGEGVQSSASYHARSLNETVHNFLFGIVALMQLAMFGFLTNKGPDQSRPWFAWVTLAAFVYCGLFLLRRLCAWRSTKVEAVMPERTLADDTAMPETPSGFGYYNDGDSLDPTGSMVLSQRGSGVGWGLE